MRIICTPTWDQIPVVAQSKCLQHTYDVLSIVIIDLSIFSFCCHTSSRLPMMMPAICSTARIEKLPYVFQPHTLRCVRMTS